MNFLKRTIFVFSSLLFLTFAFQIKAAVFNTSAKFYIDSSYDVSGRSELDASLIKVSPKIYFFADKVWWNSQNSARQTEILTKLDSLSQEFENRIYPNLTSAFGSELKPGVDGEEIITVLLHQMKEDTGGYFRSADEFLKVQMPESNEREMIYLNAGQIDNPQFKALLAHEFMHLITFNQKDKIQGISEEVWLNEARAEYTSTFLGYDNPYEGSILQKRVKTFLEEPTDSLTEWQNKKYDYGSINLFAQYLADHYSVSILTSSLKSKKTGISSINEALEKNGFKENFSQIFTDWTVTVLINDCSFGIKYCYLNESLRNMRITPGINFLPLTGKSTLSVTDITKNWSGNWQKFIGGKGTLQFKFSSLTGLNFKIPYLIQSREGKYDIQFLALDKNQQGEVVVPDFSIKNLSFVIIPSLQTKTSGFNGAEGTYTFTYEISILERTSEQEAELIQQLQAQIELLLKQIAKIQAQINAILAEQGQKPVCSKFENNLYFGMMQNQEVSCLQEFLKSQGSEIYPEGLITGNFLNATKTAVIRFQEKYKNEILSPFGLEEGSGFVGFSTRAKINQILEK